VWTACFALHRGASHPCDGAVSFNRYEQLLFDYLENHADERRFWTSRVFDMSRSGSHEATVLDLNSQLWEYFEERSRYESPFKEIVVSEGLQRISLLNLSEYLVRMWGAVPAPKKRTKR